VEDTANKMHVSLRQINDGISLDIKGEINKSAEETLLNIIDWSNTKPSFLIFNFKDTSYINSAGISIIIRLIRSSMEYDTIIFGHGINTLQEKLFKAVGITEYIIFYPDEYSILQRIKNIDFME